MPDAKTYLKVSGLNLLFLGVGIALGVWITGHSGTVHAQTQDSTPTEAKVEQSKPPEAIPPECEHAECVATSVGMPSAAIGVLLANRASFDEITVNGYNVLKLHDATLNALQAKGILSKADYAELVAKAKVERPLRAKPRQQ
jgi:hypothetical protein